jgi:hypothetical protein
MNCQVTVASDSRQPWDKKRLRRRSRKRGAVSDAGEANVADARSRRDLTGL